LHREQLDINTIDCFIVVSPPIDDVVEALCVEIEVTRYFVAMLEKNRK